MMLLTNRTRTTLANRRGFVMPMVLFALMIMSTMAVVAINVSVSEHRSSRAVRTSLEALLAGITGLNEIQADWNDTLATLYDQLDTLSSGGTIQIDWTNLASGASYKGEVMRIDNGGQQLFLVTVEGRDGSGLPSERAVTAIMTYGGELTLGGCCEAAAMVRGGVDVNSNTGVTGTDTDPPGWASSTCDSYEQNDQPGLVIDDDTGPGLLDINSSGFVRSGDSITNNENNWASPAIEEATLDDASFDIYGGQTLDEIKAQATTILGNGTTDNIRYFWGGDPVSDSDYNDPDIFGPRVHSVGDGHGHSGGSAILGTCDYGATLNFGSPTGPCADHFPIVWINGQVELVTQEYYDCDDNKSCEEATTDAFYAQGLFVMDTLLNGFGSEFELESPGTFNSIVVGKGCIELQDGSQTYGAIYLDGAYFDEDLCDGALPLKIRRGGNTMHTDLYYSDCVVQRVLAGTGLGEAGGGDGGTTVQKLGTRWFAEVIR